MCVCFDVVNGRHFKIKSGEKFYDRMGRCSLRRATILPVQSVQVVTDCVNGNNVIHGKYGLVFETQALISNQDVMEATICLHSDVISYHN